MSQLPSGYNARPWKLEDAASVAAMINAYSMRTQGREGVEENGLAAQMQMPGLDLETDTRLIEAPGGAIAAIGFAVDLAEPHVQVQATGMVRHEDQGHGIGQWVADWIETRSRQAVERAPAEARVVVMQTVNDSEDASKALLSANGYEVCRHFWRMLIEFGEERPAPIWPDGITIRCFDPEVDLQAAFRANRDAFKDHWGYTESSEEKALERFRHRIQTDPDFDPALHYLACEGDEIAAVCFVQPLDGTDRSTGYVQSLGVRRPWRRQGLALALLHHAFLELSGRGMKGCALHVDSDSLTGATRVYEKAGMRVAEFNHAYELELRSGIDLTNRG